MTIDFSNTPPGYFPSYTESGVTFTAVGGSPKLSSGCCVNPNGTRGLLDDSTPHQEIRADIAGGATSVSVDLGDFNGDADTIFLEIFNALAVSLRFTSILIDSSFEGMLTLTLSDPNYCVCSLRSEGAST